MGEETSVKEKIGTLLAYLEKMEGRTFHLIGENYLTIREIKKLVIELFPEEVA